MLQVGFVSLCAQFGFNPQEAGRIYEVSKQLLEQHSQVVAPKKMIVLKEQAMEARNLLKDQELDLLIIQIGTFPSGELIPILTDDMDVPILLWALPEPPFDGGQLQFNSLCGAHLVASLLKRNGKKYRYIHISPSGDTTSLVRHLKVLTVIKNLRKARIGLVGSHAPGFDAMAIDAKSLKEKMGPQVIPVSLQEIFTGAQSVSKTHRAQLMEEIGQQFHNVQGVPTEKIEKFAQTYASMESAVAKHEMDAVAVRCWPEFIEGYGQAVCGTVSKLTDRGMISGCEGDVLGTLTSSIMYEFAGVPPFLADIIHADYETNQLTLWHCGAAPFSLVAPGEQVKLGEEFGIGGLNVEFPLKEGVITLARLGYLDGEYRMLLTTGQAQKIGPIVRGTVAQVKSDADVKQLLDTLFYEGWEHHLSMTYGDIAEELQELCAMLEIECKRL